ncbi:MAG TPA: mannose-1-phosphate guanylyltransferase [Thermoanaerobaculia bacterium]
MRALLLAGGGGTRLWPLSNERRPKQFLPLLSGRSLIRETFDRLWPLTEEIFVATGRTHAPLVEAELPEIPRSRILVEPARRNSGPALISAALQFAREGDEPTAAVPADQTVGDAAAFRAALEEGARLVDASTVVLMAVSPTRPEVDYGYLELANEASGVLAVTRFVEKPSAGEAEALVARGCRWNGGIFVFRPSRLLAEARRVAGALVAAVERYVELRASGDEAGAARAYLALPDISIDHAVMEKASGVRAVPLDAGWSDVGTWRSVRDLRGASDARGNLIVSEVPVLAPGVRESAIVVTPDGVLVLPFEREAELKSAVETLDREEARPKMG